VYVNTHHEVIFGLTALGALIAAYVIGVFAGNALLDKPRSRAGRFLSGTGVAVAVTLAVGGLTMGGLWIGAGRRRSRPGAPPGPHRGGRE
jgi:hypothetical protein